VSVSGLSPPILLMERAVICIFAFVALAGQAGADTASAMETGTQEAGTCSMGDPSCSHVDVADGSTLLAISTARGTAKFTSEGSASQCTWASQPGIPWDVQASHMEEFMNCVCGQMTTQAACGEGDGPMFCQWFDSCEDEPVCQNKPVLMMGCEDGEVSCYHGDDALCPDGLMHQYTCSADGQLVAIEGEPASPPKLSHMTFTSLQDLSAFVLPVIAEEDDEEFFELCDDPSDARCDLCLVDDAFLSHAPCGNSNEAGIGLTELGKGKKKSSKRGGKKPAKKSSNKGAKKSSAKGKGHAAKKAGKAVTVTAALNHYAASNGKWTIGGLNKPDVFSLITRNGLA